MSGDFLAGFLNIRRNAEKFLGGKVKAIRCRWCQAEVPLNHRTGSLLCLRCDWPDWHLPAEDAYPPTGFRP